MSEFSSASGNKSLVPAQDANVGTVYPLRLSYQEVETSSAQGAGNGNKKRMSSASAQFGLAKSEAVFR